MGLFKKIGAAIKTVAQAVAPIAVQSAGLGAFAKLGLLGSTYQRAAVAAPVARPIPPTKARLTPGGRVRPTGTPGGGFSPHTPGGMPRRQAPMYPQYPQYPRYAPRPMYPQYAAPQRPMYPQYAAPQRPMYPQYAAPQRPMYPQYAAPQRPMYSYGYGY